MKKTLPGATLLLQQLTEHLSLTSAIEIGPDDELLESGVIDSFGVFSFLSFLEHQYGVNIPEEEVTSTNFCSVRKVAFLLEKLV